MRAARKLRIVEGCPQPDPPPFRPIQYGAAPWSRLPHNPTADQLVVRCRVQSARSKGGKRAELLSYEDSLAWEREQQSMPAAATKHDSPSREVAAGSYSTPEEWDAYYEGRAPKPEHPPF